MIYKYERKQIRDKWARENLRKIVRNKTLTSEPSMKNQGWADTSRFSSSLCQCDSTKERYQEKKKLKKVKEVKEKEKTQQDFREVKWIKYHYTETP